MHYLYLVEVDVNFQNYLIDLFDAEYDDNNEEKKLDDYLRLENRN